MSQSTLRETVSQLCFYWSSMETTEAIFKAMAARLKNEQEYDIEFAKNTPGLNTKVHERIFREIAKAYLTRHLDNLNMAEWVNANDYYSEDVVNWSSVP